MFYAFPDPLNKGDVRRTGGSVFPAPIGGRMSEEQEAERKQIEALGISEANKIIAEGLTSGYIQWYRIEMLKQLVNSPNNTIIIIPEDLKSVPMIMGSN